MGDRVAIVLAGGRSSRMGRDKLQIVVRGRSVLSRCIDAALDWTEQVVVAGPEASLVDSFDPGPKVSFANECPPFGGPVAGIGSALATLDLQVVDEILLLAGDLATPVDVVQILGQKHLSPGVDGVALTEVGGWPQFLAGRYRASSLASALAALDTMRGSSVRKLMSPLQIELVEVSSEVTRDLDTPWDLEEIRMT